MSRFIFVTGGVVSSLGKGIVVSSVGSLLAARNIRVNLVKLDPYINVDPGTMSPFQHGEVFVTADGAETDLDLGHYERYVDTPMKRYNNFTAGQVYLDVINRERMGHYHGGTVQVVPHITDNIKSRLMRLTEDFDVLIVEIGGTVGDIESQPFLEAVRQVTQEVGRANALNLHITLVPYVQSAGEFKTKPTQYSVRELRSIGLDPDILICRSEQALNDGHGKKVATMTGVAAEAVITLPDLQSTYEAPMFLAERKLDDLIVNQLKLECDPLDLSDWEVVLQKRNQPQHQVQVVIAGKYAELQDAYKSIIEALDHAGIHTSCAIELSVVDADKLINDSSVLDDCDAILIPGGYGERGTPGKIFCAEYARVGKIPFLGICLGMQVAVIEYARNVCDLENANSREFDNDTPHPVFILMEEWQKQDGKMHTTDTNKLGGTQRLGAYKANLLPGSMSREIYGCEAVHERHRHRYEFNNHYINRLEQRGMCFSATNPSGLVEMIELPREDHPWFIGCQFHPEFTSNPRAGHPLFISFITAALAHKEARRETRAETPLAVAK